MIIDANAYLPSRQHAGREAIASSPLFRA
jgi:hypothetical protein